MSNKGNFWGYAHHIEAVGGQETCEVGVAVEGACGGNVSVALPLAVGRHREQAGNHRRGRHACAIGRHRCLRNIRQFWLTQQE